jgi:hypothetical protein
VLNNETRRTHTAQIDFSILRTTMDEPLLVETKSFTVAAGNSTVPLVIRVAHHRLWLLDDPCLYRMRARLKPAEGEDVHEASSCFGSEISA